MSKAKQSISLLCLLFFQITDRDYKTNVSYIVGLTNKSTYEKAKSYLGSIIMP